MVSLKSIHTSSYMYHHLSLLIYITPKQALLQTQKPILTDFSFSTNLIRQENQKKWD